jgi:Serine/threonine protein kinase
MEYVDGLDLEKLLARKPFPWAIGLLIALQALKGLNFAHKKGLVHGDFKPKNILVSKTGQVKVADFGPIHPISQALYQSKEDTHFITPAYMSPEVAKRFAEIELSQNALLDTTPITIKSSPSKENLEIEGKDISGDIWSAGVLLYRIFCGKLPFSGETFSDLVQSILNSREPIFFHFMPFLPDDCIGAINACLAKEPKNRLVSLDPLIKSLEVLIFEIGFREIEKEIQKYMADNNSAAFELEKILLGYHAQMTKKCRESGDTFKADAHLEEFARLNRKGNVTSQTDFVIPMDQPVKIQAPILILNENDTLPNSWTFFFTQPWALRIMFAVIVIIIAFLGVVISFNMLQKNGTNGNEVHPYLQKTKIDVPQPSQNPVPEKTEPVLAPVDKPFAPTQNFVPKGTRPLQAPKGKKAGHANSENKIAVKPVTKPATAKSAILKVNIKPLTAIVSLDEKDISPQEIMNGKSVTAGPHVISASASGYETYQSSFSVEPGVKQIIDISMTQAIKGSGLLHVYSYPWSDLYVDGILQGTTPTPKPLAFLEGEHDLQLRRQGYKTFSETVSVLKGQVTHIQINLEKLGPSGR